MVSPKYNIGVDGVDSVEEAVMRSSTDYVNYNDDLVSGFNASTFSGDNVYDIFDNEEILSLRIRIFGSTLMR